MNKMQAQVRGFMARMGQYRSDSPAMPPTEVVSLRNRLTQREAGEFQEAMFNADMAGAIVELCDILYVAFGSAEALGIDIEPFFNAVHQANMGKEPSNRENWKGGVIKPEGWKPANVAGMLIDMRDFCDEHARLDAGQIFNRFVNMPLVMLNGDIGWLVGTDQGFLHLEDHDNTKAPRFTTIPLDVSWPLTWASHRSDRWPR